MAHILVVTHGDLAGSLLSTAKLICGEEMTKGVECLGMTEGKSTEQFCAEAQQILDRDLNGAYLILADIFGASPCNNCLSVFRSANYRIITGVNLPILLETLAQNFDQPLPDLWQAMIECGKETIQGVYLPPQKPQ